MVWFVDNESARHGLIKGISDSKTMSDLIQAFAIKDSEAPSYSWYERVPSFSNVSDGPSRGNHGEALSVCSEKTLRVYPSYKDLLHRLGVS